jgi:hypothetical protein
LISREETPSHQLHTIFFFDTKASPTEKRGTVVPWTAFALTLLLIPVAYKKTVQRPAAFMTIDCFSSFPVFSALKSLY